MQLGLYSSRSLPLLLRTSNGDLPCLGVAAAINMSPLRGETHGSLHSKKRVASCFSRQTLSPALLAVYRVTSLPLSAHFRDRTLEPQITISTSL